MSRAVEASELRVSLSAEEDLRRAMQSSLGRFSASCASEMRSILSGMLRRTRDMRREPAKVTPNDIQGLEGSCERLWDFLEEFRSFVADAAQSVPEPRQKMN